MSLAEQPPAALQTQIEALQRQNRLLTQGLRQAERIRQLWDKSLQELQATKAALLESNAELATLYKISMAVARTVDLDALYATILDTMAEALHLAQEAERGIFTLDGEDMRFAAHQGGSREFVAAHQGMKLGQCLCGAAAQSGEVVITGDCAADNRHTIIYPTPRPHGHIIIPLKARERVMGVFYCYTPPGTVVEERKLKTFQAIGGQMGIAIENAMLYRENEALALHDPLTGLANRRCMDLTMSRCMTHAKRYRMPVSVIMLDIDHFKRYNDTHGHPAGDRLLAQVARIIRQQTREADLAVRYGGEEFLVLLPATDSAPAQQSAERLRQAVAAGTPVTVSLGVASFVSGECSMEQLIGMADAALYRAKQGGRNRVEVGSVTPG